MHLIIWRITCLGLPLLLSSAAKRDWMELQEGQSVDGYTRKDQHIYCGEIACGASPMIGVDVASFQVWPGSKYAKDKVAVYYPISISCRDYTDCGVCACAKYRVSGLAVEDFVYLGKDYATDRIKVIFRGQELAGADSQSFRVLDGPEFCYFAVDNSHVYQHDQVLSGVDPGTFYFDRSAKQNDRQANHYVIADRKHKWLFIPPNTFKVLR